MGGEKGDGRAIRAQVTHKASPFLLSQHTSQSYVISRRGFLWDFFSLGGGEGKGGGGCPCRYSPTMIMTDGGCA